MGHREDAGSKMDETGSGSRLITKRQVLSFYSYICSLTTNLVFLTSFLNSGQHVTVWCWNPQVTNTERQSQPLASHWIVEHLTCLLILHCVRSRFICAQLTRIERPSNALVSACPIIFFSSSVRHNVVTTFLQTVTDMLLKSRRK
jgi:hypothetical protein